MLRINTLRTLPFIAAAALSAVVILPSAAGAAGHGAGKVHYSDLAVGMSSDRAATTASFAYDPAFRGGVVVAAGNVDGDGTSSVTDIVIDPFNR
jgi:hypothetical protein